MLSVSHAGKLAVSWLAGCLNMAHCLRRTPLKSEGLNECAHVLQISPAVWNAY
jgi:hypothetical protein